MNLKVVIKFLIYIFLLILAFFNFGITLIILLVLQIPLIRKSILGRLPFKLEKKPWSRKKTFKYKDNLWLDVYFPKEKSDHVVLFAHGGGWISGYRRQPNNVSWYKFLVSKGFIVATIDYRYGILNDIDQLIEDISDAYNFVKDKLRPNKISLIGLSAGGHLALYYGFKYKPDIENIVAYYSPADLLDIMNSESLFARFAVSATLKRLPRSSKDVYIRYSPITYVDENMKPVLLVHGIKDKVVPYVSSVKLHKKLRSKGNYSKLLLHPFGDHGFEFVLKDEKTREILLKTVEFLRGDSYGKL